VCALVGGDRLAVFRYRCPPQVVGSGVARPAPPLLPNLTGSVPAGLSRQQRAPIVQPWQAIRLHTRASVALLSLWWLPWWIAASLPRA